MENSKHLVISLPGSFVAAQDSINFGQGSVITGVTVLYLSPLHKDGLVDLSLVTIRALASGGLKL